MVVDHESRGADPTLGQAVGEFFTARATLKQSPHTTDSYARDYRLVAAHLAAMFNADTWADVPLRRCTGRNLRSAFAVYGLTRSPATLSRAWTAWDQLFRFLVDDGVLGGNPMDAVRRPPVKKGVPKPLRGDDTPDLLLDAAQAAQPGRRRQWPQRDLAVVVVLLATGVRLAELLSLRVDAVDGREGEYRIAVTGKGGKTRTIPVSDEVQGIVVDYLTSREARFPGVKLQPYDPLFVDHRGEPMRRGGLQYLIRTTYRAAGVTSRVPAGALVHALRHTYATGLAENGASVSEIADLLGHASIATSQTYIATTGRELRAAAMANPVNASLRRVAAERKLS